MYIYGLSDPDTNTVHYIGKTSDPHRRLSQHLDSKRWQQTSAHEWIIRLHEQGKQLYCTRLTIPMAYGCFSNHVSCSSNSTGGRKPRLACKRFTW